MVRPVIFQIVGFQNSGKTTFVNKLLQKLNENGINVVTIKHHGHGGVPQLNEGKDSAQHVKSGATASLVEGEGRLILHAERQNWSLEEKIQLLSIFSPDVILIEGHKHEKFPKAVIVRRDDDIQLIKTLTGIEVIFYWEQELQDLRTFNKPSYHVDQSLGMDWIVQYLKNQLINS
ncbi:molybdopterin-guanine dinucleotide biosynthesis protein B [Cytobacillus sp. FJAT-54145]|uniref:Molybdopterin-guanine dinucleotide biosynthesis protein B n=1 Tax=Cytobacillus spartinae TaxID=3299023 RepID=A0ABW6K865_9BACI